MMSHNPDDSSYGATWVQGGAAYRGVTPLLIIIIMLRSTRIIIMSLRNACSTVQQTSLSHHTAFSKRSSGTTRGCAM